MKNRKIFSNLTNKRNKKLLATSFELGGIFIIIASLLYDLLFEFNSDLGFGTVQISGLFLGFFAVLAAGVIYRPSTMLESVKTVKLPSFILFIVGSVLLSINIVGLLIPLRNPDVYENIPYAGNDRSAQYTAEQVYEQMNQDQPGDSSRKSYVKRLTTLIFDGTVHYWEADINNDFRTQMPIYENFLLFLINAIKNEDTQYEFCSAERAIERCASVCSQSSKILGGILSRNKIPAHIITLDGHVVVRVKVEEKPAEWWILDADYGVVIEHDLTDIENDPKLVRDAYQTNNYSDGVIDTLIDIYGPEGNITTDKRFNCTQEDNTYKLKWIIPVVAMLPFSLFLITEFLFKMINK